MNSHQWRTFLILQFLVSLCLFAFTGGIIFGLWVIPTFQYWSSWLFVPANLGGTTGVIGFANLVAAVFEAIYLEDTERLP